MLPRRRMALACFALAGLAAAHFAGPAYGVPPLLLHNTSSSLPRGLYRLAHKPPVQRGEIVVLPHPPRHRAPWLMKQVVGTAGALYCWSEATGTHLLDGRPMPPPSAAARALGVPVWRGCRRLGHGELVGYGEGPSYDSRHLGPLRESQLWGALNRAGFPGGVLVWVTRPRRGPRSGHNSEPRLRRAARSRSARAAGGG
jgi:type IV secretory pathway protease TraF